MVAIYDMRRSAYTAQCSSVSMVKSVEALINVHYKLVRFKLSMFRENV